MRFDACVGKCAVITAILLASCDGALTQATLPGSGLTQQQMPPACVQVPTSGCVRQLTPPKHKGPALSKCPFSCECETEKLACSAAIAREEADAEGDLGWYYLQHDHPLAAYIICQEALKLSSSSQAARLCYDEVIKKLREERKAKLSARLAIVDARLSRLEDTEAFTEIERIQTDLAPPASPLGEFDNQMNADIATRLSRATLLRWLSLLPAFLWTMLKLLVIVLLVLLGWFLIVLSGRSYDRHKKYKTRKLESAEVEWTVWSIRDDEKQGAAGPVMDALNPANNPLLNKDFKPPSLLLVPPNATVDDTESRVWRDFLDPPRDPIDMEKLPTIEEFQKHRFNLVEAFDELDVEVGSLKAKGLMSLFRTFRKWLDKGLPAAQGNVYSLTLGESETRYACVRITCNWTTQLKALKPSSPVIVATDQDDSDWKSAGIADETLSVFASSIDDPSIDAIALSAQRASFKLFHRLIRKSSPTYATAVANFHQGVELIDRYI